MVEIAFRYAGLYWTDHVVIDQQYFRPAEVNALCGDATKIRARGWAPEYTFQSLIEEMVDYAMRDVVRPRGLRPVRAAVS
jgi:GDPmannose 4,6-dehydratase